MEQITLNIKGMSCSHCQQAVTNALKELNGVEKVEVHLDQGTADVTYDGSKVTIEKMKEAVEEQGYDVV
ncbi:copper chaperone CopZ [Novibacillus thermophilus]|uniref:Copper chaperone CopZ n=1 Tax=Novibacillus thermophilus TaxID=1471761 RepID=A0A1U9K6Q6_9BACL|nr:copper chaperone CopZ [Novibacillus thermophilus]AQS55749.1 copper-binding protein [Novibacillus thermophilus]